MSLPFLTPRGRRGRHPGGRGASGARRAARPIRPRPSTGLDRRRPTPRSTRWPRSRAAAGKPFLLLVSGRGMAEEWGLVFSRAAERARGGVLAGAAHPGAARRGGPTPRSAPRGGGRHRRALHLAPGIRRLVEACGSPLTSTSANRPGGQPAPSRRQQCRGALRAGGRAGELLVLDGGVLGNVAAIDAGGLHRGVPRWCARGRFPVRNSAARRKLAPSGPAEAVRVVWSAPETPVAARWPRRCFARRSPRAASADQVASAGTGAWEGAPASRGGLSGGARAGARSLGRIAPGCYAARSSPTPTWSSPWPAITGLGCWSSVAEGKVHLLGEFAGRRGRTPRSPIRSAGRPRGLSPDARRAASMMETPSPRAWPRSGPQ